MQLGICCSPLQHRLAARLASRVERNLGVETVIVAEESAPLMESWEQASASDAVLLMLDSQSAPGPLKRDDWQSLLEHNGTPPVAILKLENCFYPKLLERGRFFAASNGNEREAERWVERWLVGNTAANIWGIAGQKSLADWWTQVADTPGVLTLTPSDIDAVQTFASEAGPHFHRVIWIGCEGVPAEALRAEIEFRCAEAPGSRLLFILVYAEPGLAIPQEHGRHSFAIVEGRPEAVVGGTSAIAACRPSGFPGALLDWMLGEERRPEWEGLVIPITVDRQWFRPQCAVAPNREAGQRHLEALQELYRGWRRRPGLCRDAVGEAAWAIECDQVGSRELCLDLARFLLSEGKRMPEAVTWLRTLAATADDQDEFAIEAREELRWLVDEFGAYRRPQPIVSGEQAAFPFPEFFVSEDGAGDGDRQLLEELRADAAAHQAAELPRAAGRQLQFDLFS